MRITSASPRTIGCACFAASVLIVGAAWAAPVGASLRSASQPTPGATSTTVVPTTSTSTTERAADTVDVLRGDAEQVRAALAGTATKRTEAQARLASARAEAAEAADAVAAAEASEKVAADAARELDAEAKAAAVNAFIGTGRDIPLGVVSSENAQDAAWESTVLQYQAESLTDLLERQQAAHVRLAKQRRATEKSAAAAEAAEQRAAAEVDELIRLENDQAVLVAQVDERLDAALSEAAALAAIDAQAAADLAAKEQDLASAAAMSAGPAATAAPVGTPAVKAPSPTTTAVKVTIPPGPSAPATTAPPTTVPSGPVQPPAPVDTVNVGGFVVARSIADQLTRLLAAAQGAGLTFGGSAYRDINVQIDLRRQHCGPTDYDIWQRPASQCSPPTAVPGRSMHEKGLALDFTCAGVLIRDRASPCFAWLAANAAGFGFYNLPSEPWHWSTNGN